MWVSWRRACDSVRSLVAFFTENEHPISPAAGVLRLGHWTGPVEQRVHVIAATATRLRIRALVKTTLPGNGRTLHPGQTALVLRSAVRQVTG